MRSRPSADPLRMQAWLAASLDPRSMARAVGALHAEIVRFARELDVDPARIEKEGTVAKWVDTTSALAMPPRRANIFLRA